MTIRRLRRARVTLLLAAVLSLMAAAPAADDTAASGGAGGGAAMANRVVEWSLVSGKDYADPFNDVQLDVEVTAPDKTIRRIPAFWDGKQVWRVRYSSPQVGTHSWKSICSDAGNADLNGKEGAISIAPYVGDHPLYQHGFIRVSSDKRHLTYADGTPFFWLGDTWWMGLCKRLGWPEEFQQLTADRKQKGFTVIQIVAGLYPDMHPFDPRGANEAGYPWETGYARIHPEYWDAVDRRLAYLVDQGMVPCIVGAWGYFMSWMGVEKMEQHWRYIIARYGAMPVVWCAAGEANLPWYLAKGFPYDARAQVTQWTTVMRYIKANDPYHRLLTIHPTGIGRLSARHATDDAELLDLDLLQTPHGQREAVAPTVATMQTSYADHPVMPVINGEASYEMLGDTLPTAWTRQMFWLCMTNGAAGHTYGANGIWQLNRRGQPHGPSPHHPPGSNGYGIIPWDEAMHLPGSSQVGLGKRLFERFDWQSFQPHPEWSAYEADSAPGAPPRPTYGPFAIGSDAVRLIYVPEHCRTAVSGLAAHASYRGQIVDPVSGATTELGAITPDAAGSWSVPAPDRADAKDWVLILERQP